MCARPATPAAALSRPAGPVPAPPRDPPRVVATASSAGRIRVLLAGRGLAREPDLSLSDAPPVRGVRPSAAVLFEVNP